MIRGFAIIALGALAGCSSNAPEQETQRADASSSAETSVTDEDGPSIDQCAEAERNLKIHLCIREASTRDGSLGTLSSMSSNNQKTKRIKDSLKGCPAVRGERKASQEVLKMLRQGDIINPTQSDIENACEASVGY